MATLTQISQALNDLKAVEHANRNAWTLLFSS